MSNRSDDFNRADGAIGSPSDGGAAWSVLAGTWNVASNEAQCTTGTSAAHSVVLEASSAVVDVQVTRRASLDVGLVCRASDASNYILLAYGDTTAQYRLFRVQAGAFTLLASVSVTTASGDVVKLTVTSGDAYTAYKNGVSQLTGSSSFNNTATKHGMWTWNDTAARFDIFSITDNAATTTSFPPIPMLLMPHLAM